MLFHTPSQIALQDKERPLAPTSPPLPLLTLLLLLLPHGPRPALALDNGLALTPPMGWRCVFAKLIPVPLTRVTSTLPDVY